MWCRCSRRTGPSRSYGLLLTVKAGLLRYPTALPQPNTSSRPRSALPLSSHRIPILHAPPLPPTSLTSPPLHQPLHSSLQLPAPGQPSPQGGSGARRAVPGQWGLLAAARTGRAPPPRDPAAEGCGTPVPPAHRPGHRQLCLVACVRCFPRSAARRKRWRRAEREALILAWGCVGCEKRSSLAACLGHFLCLAQAAKCESLGNLRFGILLIWFFRFFFSCAVSIFNVSHNDSARVSEDLADS